MLLVLRQAQDARPVVVLGPPQAGSRQRVCYVSITISFVISETPRESLPHSNIQSSDKVAICQSLTFFRLMELEHDGVGFQERDAPTHEGVLKYHLQR